MSEHESLREKARQLIQAGTLPNHPADRTWAGRGGGADCAICGAPVQHGEIEYELEFAPPNGGARDQGPHHRVHIWCFEAWDVERRELEAATRACISSEQTGSTAPASTAKGLAGSE
jgi:hypothetical protein